MPKRVEMLAANLVHRPDVVLEQIPELSLPAEDELETGLLSAAARLQPAVGGEAPPLPDLVRRVGGEGDLESLVEVARILDRDLAAVVERRVVGEVALEAGGTHHLGPARAADPACGDHHVREIGVKRERLPRQQSRRPLQLQCRNG